MFHFDSDKTIDNYQLFCNIKQFVRYGALHVWLKLMTTLICSTEEEIGKL